MKAAFIRYYRRRGALAQALACVAGPLRAQLGSTAVIGPALGSADSAIDAESLACVLDFLFAVGVERVLIEATDTASSRARAAFAACSGRCVAWAAPGEVRALDAARPESSETLRVWLARADRRLRTLQRAIAWCPGLIIVDGFARYRWTRRPAFVASGVCVETLATVIRDGLDGASDSTFHQEQPCASGSTAAA